MVSVSGFWTHHTSSIRPHHLRAVSSSTQLGVCSLSDGDSLGFAARLLPSSPRSHRLRARSKPSSCAQQARLISAPLDPEPSMGFYSYQAASRWQSPLALSLKNKRNIIFKPISVVLNTLSLGPQNSSETIYLYKHKSGRQLQLLHQNHLEFWEFSAIKMDGCAEFSLSWSLKFKVTARWQVKKLDINENNGKCI